MTRTISKNGSTGSGPTRCGSAAPTAACPPRCSPGSQPGELFVHRNIANMLDPADDNVMSVLQYALHYLEVERVVLCGHYGCGGVQAALSCPPCRWRRNPRRWLAASASCATPCITKLCKLPMGVVLRPPRRQHRRGALSPCAGRPGGSQRSRPVRPSAGE